MNKELQAYLRSHDLNEEEEEQLKDWVSSGHSVSSNPEHQYDDYGEEIPYMRWYWMKEDPLLNDIWKAPLTKAMNLDEEIYETCDVSEYLCHLEQTRRILRDEILLYRRFLAQTPGAVREYEAYRSGYLHKNRYEPE